MQQHGSKDFARRRLSPSNPWSEIQHFKSIVMMHINFKGITNAATW